MEYYDWLTGVDLALYPSYYEPWGYTPLESEAFGVPTITTDLAGFGVWVEERSEDASRLTNGVEVLHRDDGNYFDVCSRIADDIVWLTEQPAAAVAQMGERARKLAAQAGWKQFVENYVEAYRKALSSK